MSIWVLSKRGQICLLSFRPISIFSLLIFSSIGWTSDFQSSALWTELLMFRHYQPRLFFFWTLLILSWLILVFSSPVILSERLLSPSSSSSSSSSLLPSLWSSSLVKLNQTFFRPFDENHAQFYQKKKNWIVKFSYFMLFKKLNQIFWRPDSLVRESLWS